MDPRVTSPVPTVDAMGMAFVPVYAAADSAAATAVPGYAPVRLDDEARRLAGVQTTIATRERLARSIRTVGVVTPDETRLHHVHVKVAGFVEHLFLGSTGQRVYAGDPAFTFYSPELLASQEEFLAARQALRSLPGGVPSETRAAATDLLAAARRRLELYDVPQSFMAQLERTGKSERTVTMLAHATGYVTMKNVVEGQQVEPGAELFTITDLESLWIEADFYENEARLVRVGQQATLTLPYDPLTQFTGRVAYVYPYFDPQTRTLKVRFQVANPTLVLKPAMYVDVALEVEAADGVVIPESAVLDTGVRQIVFVETAAGLYEPARRAARAAQRRSRPGRERRPRR
jgi:multidrug efflux pump subunit AcrA (membrane-fusion protein)